MKKKRDSLRKINLVLKVYRKLVREEFIKKHNFNKLPLAKKIKVVLLRIKRENPEILNKISLRGLAQGFRLKIKKKKIDRVYKQRYKVIQKFFTPGLRKILKYFPRANLFGKNRSILRKKLRRMKKIFPKKNLKKNFKKRSFFYKVLMKTIRKKNKTKFFRSHFSRPIFTKKSKKEKKFLLSARDSLIQTKKYLYRKRFPKIKGRKNKNFNFFYYNNIERMPLKFFIGRVVITYLINNTFINIHSSKKMMKVISAGSIGFKGPKRATPYSRQIVARKAVTFLLKTKLNVLDVFLNSNYNRWYYFLFKEISKPKVKPYIIRYLIISNPRPHGFIRDKKHRRK